MPFPSLHVSSKELENVNLLVNITQDILGLYNYKRKSHKQAILQQENNHTII